MARTGTVKAKSKVLTVGDEKGWPQQTFARRCGHTPLRLDNQTGGSQIAKDLTLHVHLPPVPGKSHRDNPD